MLSTAQGFFYECLILKGIKCQEEFIFNMALVYSYQSLKSFCVPCAY